MTNSYDELMQDVYDSKDLGSGVINGVECDTLAFRKNDVDWQIWIAQGDRPYPCQFVITSKLESADPQYTIQFGDWKFGNDVAADDFSFKNSSNAKQVALTDVQDKLGDLPENFKFRRCKMTKLKRLGLSLGVVMLGLPAMGAGERLSVPGVSGYVATAEARVGRPLTPVSVAGVARRTTRRCATGVYNC